MAESKQVIDSLLCGESNYKVYTGHISEGSGVVDCADTVWALGKIIAH